MQYSSKLIRLLLLLALPCSIEAMAQDQDSASVRVVSARDSLMRANAPKVTGVVKDAATGSPIAGIYVGVDGFSSVITNERGEFTISIPNSSALLTLGGQGYQEKEVAVKGRSSLSDILLFEETYKSVYDEARMPFDQVRASKQANSIETVNTLGAWEPISHELSDSYLQGRVSGLNAVRRSGTLNSGANLFLRGYSSLYGTNAPLIVVDGMIYDTNTLGNSSISGFSYNPFSNLDLRDVSSYTVLKDASAGIYGTKGANGVILISTHNRPELATKIDFGIYGSFNYLPKSTHIPMMQAGEFRTYLSDVLGTSGQSPDQIAAMPYMNDSANPEFYTYRDASGQLLNTDWQKRAFTNPFNNNYNLRVSGGDNIARYVLSMAYGNSGGLTESTDMTRYSTRFNGNLNISEKLAINTSLSFAFSEQNLRDQGLSPKTNPLYLSLVKAPFLRTNQMSDGVESPNLADVDALGYGNPAALGSDTYQMNQNYRFFGNIEFKYSFNKYFSAQTLFGITTDKVRENVFIPRLGIANDTIFNSAEGLIGDSRLGSQVQRLFDIFSDTHLSYNRTLNNIHSLGVYLGTRYKQADSELASNRGYNSAIDQLVSVGNALTGRSTAGELGTYRWMNNYLNANYQLNNKYIFGFNLAVDGSSRFGTQAKGGLDLGGAKFAVLPSVSAAWVASSESFMANLKNLELLKLRVSYGLTGNDDIGNYAARRYYVSQNLLGLQGLVRANFGNPELQWEVNKKLNAGLDASFFQERLSMSVDIFKNETDKMIVQESVPSFTGFAYALTNSGGMQTTGVDFSLNSRVLSTRDIKWDLGFNLSRYKNEITKIPGNSMESYYAGATVLTRVGLPANVFYGYKTNGVYSSNQEAQTAGKNGSGVSVQNQEGNLIAQQGGDVRFVDVNGDDIIDGRDRQVIGDPNPDFTGGVHTGLSYKRFSFNALVTFTKGNDIYNYTRRELESQTSTQNQTQAILNRWRGDGQITNIPRASFGDPSGNASFSDRWIEDGSYVRLRTVSMSYEIPLNYKFLKYAKVYVTGNNLLTFTRYLGYDPEVTGGTNLLLQGFDSTNEPQYKTMQLGVRIGI